MCSALNLNNLLFYISFTLANVEVLAFKRGFAVNSHTDGHSGGQTGYKS